MANMNNVAITLTVLGVTIALIAICGIWHERRQRLEHQKILSIIISLNNTSDDDEENTLEGVAEAAINIINQEWALKHSDSDDDQVKQAW